MMILAPHQALKSVRKGLGSAKSVFHVKVDTTSSEGRAENYDVLTSTLDDPDGLELEASGPDLVERNF